MLASNAEFESLRQELISTKRYYETFKRKVNKLNLESVMENEKSFCFFGADHQGVDDSRIDESLDISLDLSFNSNTDKSTLFEMKKYKNLATEDV
jgi:hypothetical protein